MNARFRSTVRVGLTAAALTLCGALALTTSGGCAGSSDNTGGSSGGGTGGSTGGSTGGGNTGGGNTGGGSCGANSVCFSAGKASGLMTGYGWIALGSEDTATSPVCDNTANNGSANQQITTANPCPETGGKTVWTTPDAGLCISGSIPAVSGPTDYTANWGLQIGANVDTSGGTLGKSYSSITYTFNASAITPANTAIRAEVHRAGDDPGTTYCATILSGKATSFVAFNTQCWPGGSGTAMTSDDVAKIDKIGIQISSDTGSAYAVSGFCWSGLSFAQ